MRRTITVLLAAALLVMTLVAPAAGGDGKGKGHVNAAFRALGSGAWVVGLGTAAQATKMYIPAHLKQDGVRIFAYEGSESEGKTYCGDAWNVIVTASFVPVKSWLDGTYATHWIDRGQNPDPVGANEQTAAKYVKGTVGEALWFQAYGTFVAPGTLSDGTHKIKAVLANEFVGVLWNPDPVTIHVDDSAC